MPRKQQLQIGRASVEVSNLDKILYPKTGFTKGHIIDYYIKISRVLLPHLKDRPLTLKRYPEGVEGFFFYEKQCPEHRPKWVKTGSVPRSEGGEICYCLINNLPSLVWVANLASLELHTFLHRAPKIDRPTALAFDLDPGAPADIISCCDVAMAIRDIFDALHLESFPKTSGSKGLQVYVPLNSPVTYERTKAFALSVAERLTREMPGTVVSRMQRSLRKGKVFVDWSQNDSHKTTICVYSLRAKERPTVSTPVTWDEIAMARNKKRADLLTFESGDVLERVQRFGDLFEPALKLKQKLPGTEAFQQDEE